MNSEQLASQASDQDGHGNKIIYIAWGEVNLQQFPPVIDRQVQLAAVETAYGGLAPICRTRNHLVSLDTPVVANFNMAE